MIVDGLFFHPEGSTPKHVLDRMLDGTTNPRLDDIFAPALNASLAEVRKLAEQVQDAEDRLAVLEGAKQRAVELVAEWTCHAFVPLLVLV